MKVQSKTKRKTKNSGVQATICTRPVLPSPMERRCRKRDGADPEAADTHREGMGSLEQDDPQHVARTWAEPSAIMHYFPEQVMALHGFVVRVTLGQRRGTASLRLIDHSILPSPYSKSQILCTEL